MPDPYWDAQAKAAAERRARGLSGGKELFFTPKPAGASGKCPMCGEFFPEGGPCACYRQSKRSVNGAEPEGA